MSEKTKKTLRKREKLLKLYDEKKEKIRELTQEMEALYKEIQQLEREIFS